MTAMTYTTTTRRISQAEWTKLRTLPSTWRTAVLTVVMAIGFGSLWPSPKPVSGTP
jgi:hypothetical protein